MMKKIPEFLLKQKTLIMILLFCLFTAIMQGNSYLFYQTSHAAKSMIMALVIFGYFVLLYICYIKKLLNEENKIFFIILAGVILRSFYVIFTGVNDRQHDEGAFSSLYDTSVNAGHLGYIEYLCKFKHLPDFSPYEMFSYYHPPVHHILSALFIGLNIILGVGEELAFENVQVLTLFYSSVCIMISYGIFKKLHFQQTGICLATALIAFHPGMIFMSGSVNNDMLATTLTFACFYFAITWIREKTLVNLIKIALSLGFGMITKLNVAVMAFPLAVVFLLYFIDQVKAKSTLKCIRDYAIFLVITAGIGLSWVIRNLIFYRTNPGVPVLTEESILYIGRFSLWDIFGIPTNFLMEYPFHTINGTQICNAWLILFRTSIFAEVRPADLSDFLMALCQIALVLAMVFGILYAVTTIVMQIKEIKRGNKELGIFLLSGYIAVVLTFIAFIIKYPYTCSCDFRYVVISILFTAITICQLNVTGKESGKFAKNIAFFFNGGILFLLSLTTMILLFWNQW
ncbi:MAG: glycosyltransferase family 39 protein [Lachnospiraceae bacterium]|nr:glycosyltransferase family 39 protein [Lachnospiraceae bacterium]